MERSAIGVETFPPLDGMMTSVADPPEDCSPLPTNPHPHHHHQPPPTTGRGLGGGRRRAPGGPGRPPVARGDGRGAAARLRARTALIAQ